MSLIIKNALVTTEQGSYRAKAVTINEDQTITVGPELKQETGKEIDASKVVSDSIIHWFNS